MKKRTPKEWQRLVAEDERGFESRWDFCERYGLATSTLDCKIQTDSMPSSKLAKACAYVLGQLPKRASWNPTNGSLAKTELPKGR